MTIITGFLPLLLQWLARRGLELGGILVAIGSVNPEALQSILLTLGALFTGNWDDVSLGALVGIISTVVGLVWNGRSTFRPQVITSDRKRVTGPVLTEAQARAVTGYTGPILDRSKR